MDTDQFALGGGAIGIISAIVFVISKLYKDCNHKRFRSKCMEREVVVSVDIDNTTPPPIKPPAVPVEV